MAAYMKSIAPFFGIKAPDRKVIARELFDAYKTLPFKQLPALVKALCAQPERELHYLAMDWLYYRRKEFTPQTIHIIVWMLGHKSWWDTVDFIATRCLGVWAEMYPQEAAPAMQQLIRSDNIWLARSAIIHQMHYGRRTDTALLSAAILPHASSKEFFLQKAIGWALRHYARTNAAWVRAFTDATPLAALSRREARKYL